MRSLRAQSGSEVGSGAEANDGVNYAMFPFDWRERNCGAAPRRPNAKKLFAVQFSLGSARGSCRSFIHYLYSLLRPLTAAAAAAPEALHSAAPNTKVKTRPSVHH